MLDHDPEGPDDLDQDLIDEADDSLADCAECGYLMYAQAVKCPNCGAYRMNNDRPRKPLSSIITYILVGVIVGFMIIYGVGAALPSLW